MGYIISIFLLFTFIFPRELYKEIRIGNIPFSTIPYLSSLGIDLDHIYKDEEFIQFAISNYDLDKLDFHNVNYQIIHDNLEEFYAQRLTNDFESRDFELGSMGGYYTYEELEEQLSQINSEYPSLTELIVIGNTFEGRNVWALKLSDNASQDENEPEVLYTGLHHAREPMGYMNLFFFMDWLLENYNTDDLATHLINNRQLWFIPAVNPDGLVYNESIAPNGGGMQRKNMRETCDAGADGIDLNRNYSYMWAYDNEGSSPDGCNETYRGNSPFSEPETQIVRDFVLSHDFPIALNYHSYGNLFIYPLGYEYDNQVPEDDLEVFIVRFNLYANFEMLGIVFGRPNGSYRQRVTAGKVRRVRCTPHTARERVTSLHLARKGRYEGLEQLDRRQGVRTVSPRPSGRYCRFGWGGSSELRDEHVHPDLFFRPILFIRVFIRTYFAQPPLG